MKTIATIGLILITGAGLTIAPRLASSGNASERNEPRWVVRPTLTNTEASLDLVSFGVAELEPEGGTAITVLHLRAVVANTTDARPWVVDASKARLDVAGAVVVPAFVNADVPTLPVAILAPGERRVIDLYFPLPADLTARGEPASFALSWPVNTPARAVRSAWFEHAAAIGPSHGDLALSPGWGAAWWFDPKYAWSTYARRPGPAMPRPPSYVVMSRSPRWEAPSPDDASVDQPPRETECDVW